jgi:DNA-binding CsgD family transcriptional regulator
MAAAEAQLGRVDEGLALISGVDLDETLLDSPLLALALLSVRGLCHLMRGGLREAAAAAASLTAMGVEDGWPLAFTVGSLLAGRCALAQARPQVASLRLSESAAGLSELPVGAGRRLVLESLSVARLMGERPSDGAAVQEDAARMASKLGMPQLLVCLADLTHADYLQLLGQTALAGNVAQELFEQERAAGRHLTALLAAHLLVRLHPSSEVADSVVAAGRECDFELARTYAGHATAAAAGDAAALDQTAKMYDELGLTWLAAETAASALAAAHDDAPRWAPHARRLIGQVRDQEPVTVPRWWGEVGRRGAPLTAREREIAEAVMRGATSAHVADELSLSRRTVENHLQHVFRKLGISRREELAACLSRMQRS